MGVLRKTIDVHIVTLVDWKNLIKLNTSVLGLSNYLRIRQMKLEICTKSEWSGRDLGVCFGL